MTKRKQELLALAKRIGTGEKDKTLYTAISYIFEHKRYCVDNALEALINNCTTSALKLFHEVLPKWFIDKMEHVHTACIIRGDIARPLYWRVFAQNIHGRGSLVACQSNKLAPAMLEAMFRALASEEIE